MAAKKKAAKAGAAAVAAKNSPYVQRLIEDEDLRESIVEAYESADRKSTRLNSSHANISYAVFCLKKKKKTTYYHKHYSESPQLTHHIILINLSYSSS